MGFLSTAIFKNLDWNALEKNIFLIDTFSGPNNEQFNEAEVEAGRVDEVEYLKRIGGYNYSLKGVTENFGEWKNVNIVQGLIPDVLKSIDVNKVCYLHIDLNCVLPEVESLMYFWDKMVPGGVILLDDYAFRGFELQGEAMRNVAKEKCVEILSLPTGQGLLIKPPEN